MKLLLDRDLTSLILQKQFIKGVVNPDEQIKGASIDLTVGDIFVPGVRKGELGAVDVPRKDLSLQQGQTAVIRTAEQLNLDVNHAGIAFPASAVSLKGLLMTNPGHVDPGYGGHLHVTVINMGKEPYSIRAGDRLLRLLVIELHRGAQADYPARSSPINLELLARLSHDFVGVQRRAEEAATAAVRKAEIRSHVWQVVAPVLAALVGVLGASYVASQKIEDRIAQLDARIPDKIQERLSKAEALVPLVSRLDNLELQRLRALDDRLSRLEQTRAR